jgi:salicylate hydroxylase
LDTIRCVLRIAIVGAGLGGLSAAIALRRTGHAVTVLEQAPQLGEVGAGIQTAPNASRLLDAWGVLDALGGRSVAAQASNRRRWATGELLGSFALGDSAVQRYGAPYLCQHRADLHAAMTEVAVGAEGSGDPVEIVLGASVEGAIDHGGEVEVEAGGDGPRRFDALIAADGIASRVRDHTFGADGEDTPTDQLTQRMIVDLARVADDAAVAQLVATPALNIWLGPGRHAVLHPVRGTAGVYLGVTTQTDSPAEALAAAQTSQEQLIETLRDWDPRLTTLARAADGMTSWPLFDRDVVPTWVRGRVALMGDACHAMLPFQAQGAAQAIEDGAVLGDLLADAGPADVPAALRAYEAARRPRATRVLEASRGNSPLFHFPDGPEQVARDAELAQGTGDFRAYLWLWAANPDGSDAPLGAATTEG